MSEQASTTSEEGVGYGRPPKATRFMKGQSGNPRGRPRSRRREIPYDSVLGQMVSVREDGRERRITAAEAFLLQLTKKGLAGDSASARATLEAIENARAKRPADTPNLTVYLQWQIFGVSNAVEDLGLGIMVNAFDKDKARLLLKPWIVEAALSRLGDRRLTADEQKVVVESTKTPRKVRWPTWWTERG